MQQIKSFGVLQSAKVMSLVYAILGILVAVGFVLARAMHRGVHHPRVLVLLIFVPILYGILGFVLTVVVCGIYNWVARRLGGIEIELAP
jgi:uncharacterized membrane protein (DUF485 family)